MYESVLSQDRGSPEPFPNVQSQLGCCSKSLVLGGSHANEHRSRDVCTSPGIVFVWLSVLSLHSVFLLPFLLVVLTAVVLIKSLTIP